MIVRTLEVTAPEAKEILRSVYDTQRKSSVYSENMKSIDARLVRAFWWPEAGYVVVSSGDLMSYEQLNKCLPAKFHYSDEEQLL